MAPHKCKCGTWNNDSALFCRNCGKKLQHNTSSAPNPVHTPSKSSSSNSDDSFLAILGIIAIVGAAILFFTDTIPKYVAIAVAVGGIGLFSKSTK